MKKIGVALLGVIMLVVFAGAVQAEIKIGVLAKRGAETAMAKWQATGDYLTAKLGEPVTIIPLKFVAIEPMVKDGKIDFMLANSAFYVEMEKKYGAKAVSTIINSMDGKALKEFGGVVFVRADSPIQTLADIKGKKFMCV
ncbi:MAG: PhnD/SsuA/transferrin family substrate-binding protein, partial [Proteobacteria bacterium]|nr:PhnD/SsuA/transferrin family substrate-binding protein [Pseudomonadota bacterium]